MPLQTAERNYSAWEISRNRESLLVIVCYVNALIRVMLIQYVVILVGYYLGNCFLTVVVAVVIVLRLLGDKMRVLATRSALLCLASVRITY